MGNLESSTFLCCSDINPRQEGDVRLDNMEGRIVPIDEGDTPQWGAGEPRTLETEQNSFNQQFFGKIDDYSRSPLYYSPEDKQDSQKDQNKIVLGKNTRNNNFLMKKKNFDYLNNVVKLSLDKSNKVHNLRNYEDMVNKGVLDRLSIHQENDNDMVLYSSFNSFDINSPMKNSLKPTSTKEEIQSKYQLKDNDELSLNKRQILKPVMIIEEESKIGADRYTKDLNFNESKFEQSQFTSSVLTQKDHLHENMNKEVQQIPSGHAQNNDDKIDELFGDNVSDKQSQPELNDVQEAEFKSNLNDSLKPEQTPEELNEANISDKRNLEQIFQTNNNDDYDAVQLKKMNSIINQGKIDMMFDNDESFENKYEIRIEQNKDNINSHSSLPNNEVINKTQSKASFNNLEVNNIEWDDFENFDNTPYEGDFLAPNVTNEISRSSALRRSS